jgi:putative ABC transport system permease protein
MFRETLLLALREIRRNVLRSSLTILGIVIGVAAVITMVTIGEGATVQVSSQIRSLGSNLLSVRPGQQRRGPGGAREAAKPFESKDVEAIAREIGGIAAIAPANSRNLLAINAELNWSTTVTGTDNDYFKVRNWPLAAGRVFADSERHAGAMACVLGASVRDKLFGAQDPVGATIRLGALACEVIGVLAAKGQSSFGMDQDDLIVIPLRALQRRIAGNQYIDGIMVSVQDGVSTKKVQADIESLLRERRRLGPREEADFHVMDMQQIVAAVSGTTQILTALLGAVAAVSLLVGGIGIMNIMLVSVTERTKEIGVRKALGATRGNILLQFLIEAIVLCMVGGIMGILIGSGGAIALAKFLQWNTLISPVAIAVAFVFSAAVGLFFGAWPASRAAKLDPIAALRYE